MLARGFKPIPIFTRGESPSVLEDFYKTSDVVGIGGLVGTRGNRGFVKGIMEKVKNRRVHWLGFSGIPFIHVYKPYMCDSSSWASSLLYASVTLIGPRLKETRLTKKHFENLPPREVFNLLAWYGEDIAKLRQKSEWKNSATGKYVLERIAMKAGVRRCIDIESIYGTKFFLAVGHFSQIRLMTGAFDYWLAVDQRSPPRWWASSKNSGQTLVDRPSSGAS